MHYGPHANLANNLIICQCFTLFAVVFLFWRDPGVSLKGRISRLPEQVSKAF